MLKNCAKAAAVAALGFMIAISDGEATFAQSALMRQQQQQQQLMRQQQLQRQQQQQAEAARRAQAAAEAARRAQAAAEAGRRAQQARPTAPRQAPANSNVRAPATTTPPRAVAPRAPTASAPTAAIRGNPTRNVGPNERRGFVSSGGTATLTRALTPGEIRRGFTGRVTGDGRALVRFQGRVFAVPAAGLSIRTRPASSQSVRVAGQNARRQPATPQQRQAAVARTQAALAQLRGRGGGQRPPQNRIAANDNSNQPGAVLSRRRADLGQLRAPAKVPLPHEAVLINQTQGLQTRRAGRFANVRPGVPGDPSARYLWTIDDRGINIVLEKETGRQDFKHTNLSESAYIGGEAWFDGDSVVINGNSGRFGTGNENVTTENYAAASSRWRELGYTVRPIPFGER